MNLFDLLLVSLCLISVFANEHIPPGRVLTVFMSCGEEVNGGLLTVNTDLKISATATCLSEYKAPLHRLNLTTYTLSVMYRGDSTRACVFTKRLDVYAVQIQIDWRERDVAPVNKEIYHATCTYNGSAFIGNVSHPILKNVIYPKVIEVYQGKVSERKFSLLLVDVLNRRLDGVDVRTGKKVQLKAFVGPPVSNTDQYTSLGNFQNFQLGVSAGTIYPVSCDAVGATHGKRYTILRAGCGDGIVLNQHDGFSLKKNMAESPFFKYFHIEGDDKLKFECNFTICENCVDENSCSSKPKPSVTLDKLWNEFMAWLAQNKTSTVGKRSVPGRNPGEGAKRSAVTEQRFIARWPFHGATRKQT